MRTIIKKGNISLSNDIPEEILNKDTYVEKIQTSRTRELRHIKTTDSEIVEPIEEIIEIKEIDTKKIEDIKPKELKKIPLEKADSEIKKEIERIQLENAELILPKSKLKKIKDQETESKLFNKIKKIIREPELTFNRAVDNPIICPKPENGWESWQTFNPAAILIDDKVHFLYRAIGDDGLSRFGYAMSQDGFTIRERLSFPAYVHEIVKGPYVCLESPSGGSFGGCEDPRLVRVENENRIYVTYTACDGGLRVGLTSIKVSDFINKRWNWKKPKIISPPGECHKNWLIFPEKINGKYAILHSINSGKILIDYFENLDFKDGAYIKSKYQLTEVRADRWDKKVRAAGPPPIRTKYGWLLFYHAEDKDDPGKYKVGAMILDITDPTKILYRCKQPVLEPKEYYECEGYKGGIVYALGAVIKDDKLIIYYGGADNFVCVAYTEFGAFLEALIRGEKKPLKFKTLKKK
jgi:beta-1,2-mannobiose phosphorylase / 1,2-beta-oligomannan phosphorylase